MGEPSVGIQPAEKPLDQRLDSWKEIAAYLNRDVTTVQRWEKREGMPVHRHLHDKRGSVYAVTSELDAWLKSRRPVLEEDEENVAESPQIDDGNLKQEPKSRKFRWIVLGGVVAAVVLLAAVHVATRSHQLGDTAPAKIKSLAVLPLKNLSGDASQEYLADGMTEALIGRLAGIRDLRVISHTSVMRFKNPQVSVPEIARTLGVDAIVEGSVIRDGNRIRVTAQLIRAATDEHFWSESYDRELRDSIALESEIAQAIAEKVEVTVSGEEQRRLTEARPVSPEVYESYLKGRFALDQGNSRASIEESIGDFDSAIKQDSAFVPAYLGLAQAYSALGTIFAGTPRSETRPKAIDAVQAALKLDPDLAEAHILLANILQKEWHWAEAEAEYKRALELAPNDASAHAGYAFWLLSQGRTDEAVAWIQHARVLDPVAVTGADVSEVLFQAHRYDESIREARSALAVQPNNAYALWTLGFALIANNQAAEAVPILEKALSLSQGSPGVAGVLIRAYANAGRRDDALRELADLKRRSSTGYVPAGAFVNAYLGLGNNEQAFAALEQAYKEKSAILQWVKTHPYFDPIRDDPRFKDLVHRVGLG